MKFLCKFSRVKFMWLWRIVATLTFTLHCFFLFYCSIIFCFFFMLPYVITFYYLTWANDLWLRPLHNGHIIYCVCCIVACDWIWFCCMQSISVDWMVTARRRSAVIIYGFSGWLRPSSVTSQCDADGQWTVRLSRQQQDWRRHRYSAADRRRYHKGRLWPFSR